MPRPKNKKQFFKFNTFSNGHSYDPSNWKTHGAYSAGLDLLGIADITGAPIGGRPNVIQLAQNLKADAVSSTTSPATDYHLTGLPEWIKRWDAVNANDLYALVPSTSGSNSGLILRNVSGTTTWVSAQTTGNGVGGGGFGSLSATAYYGQDSNLGQITSALVFNNTFASFTLGKQTPRPMVVFAGVLNIGNDRYISTVDSNGTFVANALSLPSGYTIRSLEVLGDYLIISADYAGRTRIFLWSGGTATFQEAYDLPELTAPNLISKEGRVYAIGSQIYQLNEVSFSVIFPYSTFGTPFTISPITQIQSPILGETAIWRNRILFAIDQPNGGFTNADDVGGVWLMGNNELQTTYNFQQIPFINTLYFLNPTVVTSYAPFNVQTGGIYADHTSTIKIGFRDTHATATSAQYKIATLDSIYTPVSSSYAYYVTLPIDCDSNAQKIFHSIRLTMGATTATIDVYYRLNTDFTTIYAGTSTSNWTLLKSAVSNVTNNIAIPIRQMGMNIQFKFVFTPINGISPQLLDYGLLYELLDQYR